jgi:dihydrolipoamide dehydrogenase
MDFDLIVIGAGPAGYGGAIRASQLGMKVACIEKRSHGALGGTCLQEGCIPSKALLHSSHLFAQAEHEFRDHGISTQSLTLDLSVMMARKNKVVSDNAKGIQFLLKKNNISLLEGKAELINGNQICLHKEGQDPKMLSASYILIATGSTPISLPHLPIDEEMILSSKGALSLSSVPNHLAVVGSGVIGLEMGSVWKRLGAKVTVIELGTRILPNMDHEMGQILYKSLLKQGLAFKFSTKVMGAEKQEKGLKLDLGGESMAVDKLLLAIGRKPYTEGLGLEKLGIAVNARGVIQTNAHAQTCVDSIYAVGDVAAGPMLAHKAHEEALFAVEHMCGKKPHLDFNKIPSVVYTWPEMASVGYSEENLKQLSIPYKIGKFPFSANGRARACGEDEGSVKILSHAQEDYILGAHIVGPHGGELIAQLALALEFKASCEDIALTSCAHPSLSEAVKEACLAVMSRAIHI